MAMVSREMRKGMQKVLAWHIEILIDTLGDATGEDKGGLRDELVAKYEMYKKLGGRSVRLEKSVKGAYDAAQR